VSAAGRGHAHVNRAGILVIARNQRAAAASARRADIPARADVAVRTRKGVVRVHASARRIAGIRGARILIVAVFGRADADSADTEVAFGTGVSVVAVERHVGGDATL